MAGILPDRMLDRIIAAALHPYFPKETRGFRALAAGQRRRVLPEAPSILHLAPLPLHANAGGSAGLDSDTARSGSIGPVDVLQNDTLTADIGRSDLKMLRASEAKNCELLVEIGGPDG